VVTVRPEIPADQTAVFKLNAEAFETNAEAVLVDRLREASSHVISLVAELERRIVGHIMFSPVSVGKSRDARIIGLAPMAVHPQYQRQGIGSLLVEQGIKTCRQESYQGIVVLGHPEYYPRFGFAPASSLGLSCEYDVPAEVFMVLELETGSLSATSGLVRYHNIFQDV